MAPQVQVQRVAEGTWQFTRVLQLRPHVYQYDVLAQVVRDGGMYYVEMAYWEGGSQRWQRRPRGYQLFRGAERAASDYALGKVEGS